jgi:hypothetical protein
MDDHFAMGDHLTFAEQFDDPRGPERILKTEMDIREDLYPEGMPGAGESVDEFDIREVPTFAT